MTRVQYSPWSLMSSVQRQLDRAFEDAFAKRQTVGSRNIAWIPSVDVHEATDRFVIRADLPGVDRKDIEITAEDGVLTLRAERRTQTSEPEHPNNGAGYSRRERVAGTFLRRFTLPETANAQAITATQSNGVLELSIPKQPKPEARRIQIYAA